MRGHTSTVSPCGHGRDSEMMHAAIDLSGLEAPQSAARRIIRTTLAELGSKVGSDYADDVVLVADELVGNAVEHAAAVLDISLFVYAWGVVVQVRDSDDDITTVPRTPSAADESDEGGRGLFLVDVLANTWGVQHDSTGKRVIAIFLYRTGDVG